MNALVFLFREVFQRQLGDFSDFRAKARPHPPVWLTREEIQRLLVPMDAGACLMAKLMYGGGLRLMELLRLRVKDLDLEHEIITIRGGKGDKGSTRTTAQKGVVAVRDRKPDKRLAGGERFLWVKERLSTPVSHETGYLRPPVSHETSYLRPPVSHETGYFDRPVSHETGYFDRPVSHETGYLTEPATSGNRGVGCLLAKRRAFGLENQIAPLAGKCRTRSPHLGTSL